MGSGLVWEETDVGGRWLDSLRDRERGRSGPQFAGPLQTSDGGRNTREQGVLHGLGPRTGRTRTGRWKEGPVRPQTRPQ